MKECCVGWINMVPVVGGGLMAFFVLGVIVMTGGGIYEITQKNYSGGIGFMAWGIGSFWVVWPEKDLFFRIAEAML